MTSQTLIEKLRSEKALLSPERLANWLGMEVGSLAARRTRKQAPAFIKVGSNVRYDPAVVADWLEPQTIDKPATPRSQSPLPSWLDASSTILTGGHHGK